MKTKKGLALFFALFASSLVSHAITNTMISVSGTNIVLSWPSYGYESYLIQYRQTLDVTDSWSQLINDYPANSTNLTTFIIYGVVQPPANGGGDGGNFAGEPPSPDAVSGSIMAGTGGPLVLPAGEAGGGVPLILYPPGFDLSGYSIFDPLTSESVSGAGYSASPSFGGASPFDDPSDDPPAPTTGFFRVFHIPNWLADITNYTFDGPTFIPVDYSAPDAPVNYVDSATVLINGQPTDQAALIPYDINETTYWGMGIYFDRIPNGTNIIQLLTTVRESDALNDNTPYMVFSNAPVAITIDNFVTYTNWDDLIWDNTNYTFKAQCSTPNINWEIDIYDINDNFVNFQTGYSADGNISWTWDLTDYTGASRSDADNDPFFYAYISITNSSGDPSGWMPPVAAQFPTIGSWIITYMDNFLLDAGPPYNGGDIYYKATMSNMAGGPSEWSIPVADFSVKYGTNYTQTDRNLSWTNLMSFLSQPGFRNFYYFGHGAADIIGGDVTMFDSNSNMYAQILPGSTAELTSQWVHDNVTFNQQIGNMPYRFVFLDGCNTANGSWPAAWGVPNQGEPLSFYTSTNSNPTHARPSAFVGWNATVGEGPDWGNGNNFIAFKGSWMATWANVNLEPLNQSFADANEAIGWISPLQLNQHLVIDGYETMLFREYEYGGNWP